MKYAPLHPGTFVAGFLFFLTGLVFTFEELGVWSFQLGDLWFLGPVALVIAGIAVIGSTLWSQASD